MVGLYTEDIRKKSLSESEIVDLNCGLRGNEKKIVKTDLKVIINPGHDYFLQADDVCIYVSLVKEHNFDWKTVKSSLSN